MVCGNTSSGFSWKLCFYLSALDVKFFEGGLQNFRNKTLEEISYVPKMEDNEVDTEVDIEVNNKSKLLAGHFLAMKTTSFKHYLTIMCF